MITDISLTAKHKHKGKGGSVDTEQPATVKALGDNRFQITCDLCFDGGMIVEVQVDEDESQDPEDAEKESRVLEGLNELFDTDAEPKTGGNGA